MPNWTSNSIYAEGSPEQVSDFLEALKGENGIIDFNRITPMPEILKSTGSGNITIDGQQASSWYIAERDENGLPRKQRLFTPEEEQQLAEIGYQNWYDWANANWNTKWNACNPRIPSPDTAQYGFVEIEFETAWDAPIPVMRKIVEMFPDLEITCQWRHETEPLYPHNLDDV